jgi:hypothetical protein
VALGGTLFTDVAVDTSNNISSTAAVGHLAIKLPGMSIVAEAVAAHSHNNDGVKSGDTTIASLTIGTKTVVNQAPAPNTVMLLPGGLGTVTLNEQTRDDQSLTVNAIHVSVPSLGLDVIVSSAAAGGRLDET